jgi:hypothetical protein
MNSVPAKLDIWAALNNDDYESVFNHLAELNAEAKQTANDAKSPIRKFYFPKNKTVESIEVPTDESRLSYFGYTFSYIEGLINYANNKGVELTDLFFTYGRSCTNDQGGKYKEYQIRYKGEHIFTLSYWPRVSLLSEKWVGIEGFGSHSYDIMYQLVDAISHKCNHSNSTLKEMLKIERRQQQQHLKDLDREG